jgi:hypothetical protein
VISWGLADGAWAWLLKGDKVAKAVAKELKQQAITDAYHKQLAPEQNAHEIQGLFVHVSFR